jgi:phosphoadenosine phosphosulfate reductase
MSSIQPTTASPKAYETKEKAEIIAINQLLSAQSAVQRIDWCLNNLPQKYAIASSFGVQSAVMLHLMTQQYPNIPVLLVDTGYMFAETYQFIDQLTERLNLNLHVLRSDISSAWQEARYGQLWQQGLQGLDRYNELNKVKPLQQALENLEIATWFSGMRRVQAKSRQHLNLLAHKNNRFKVHPIADWSNRDVHLYLKDNNLPYHPLWEKGYVSIGDVHTTVPLTAGMSEEQTRFHGLKRECGIYEI